MKENLFRGKRKGAGEWVYGYFVSDGENVYIFTQQEVVRGIDLGGYLDCCQMCKVDPETVGQYAGLKDRYGKKIFEGDIIRIHNDYTGDAHPFNAVVEFKEGSFVSRGEGDAFGNHFSSWYVPFVWWEIIGNIHDNPELLEVE